MPVTPISANEGIIPGFKKVTSLVLLIILAIILASCSSDRGGSGGGTSNNSPSGEDPFFQLQWHLHNSGQNYGVAGEDINVVPAWDENYKGSGPVVMIVDDGLEIAHPDLKDNVSTSYTFNYYDNTNDPTWPGGRHGTCVAGLIGAKDSNAIGVSGVAPAVTIGGNNLLAKQTAVNTYQALTLSSSAVAISNNSWGSDDGYGTFNSAIGLWRDAIDVGIQTGRHGYGTVYLFPSGNGADLRGKDNANYDGYNVHFGITVICAVGDTGAHASYSEVGANVWLCAPSIGDRNSSSAGIVTTDMTTSAYGYNISTTPNDLENKDYTKTFGGTSASTPIVAGVVALMLNANPTLSWRDVKIILAASARKNDPQNESWSTNGAGYKIHPYYGFGVVDAKAAVDLAKTWTNVGSLVGGYNGKSFPNYGGQAVNTSIPDNPGGGSGKITSAITVSGSGVNKIEYVQAEIKINHSDWGDLELILKRTYNGVAVEDQLTSEHECYSSESGSNQNTACNLSSLDSTWTFGIVRHLGEAADGVWTLEVRDKISANLGTLVEWRLTFFGE